MSRNHKNNRSRQFWRQSYNNTQTLEKFPARNLPNAFCYNRHEKLEVIKGDVFNAESLLPILEGKDAVLSCLGAHGTSVFKRTTLYSESAKAISSAMEK